jgi:hypothetical protein
MKEYYIFITGKWKIVGEIRKKVRKKKRFRKLETKFFFK